MTIIPTDDPPVPLPDTLTVAEDAGATVVDVLAGDTTAPDAGETLTTVSVTQPAHGTVTLVGGVVRYTPAQASSPTPCRTAPRRRSARSP